MWMNSKKYGFFSFIGDCIMLFITCGLWFIWIIVREARRPSKNNVVYYNGHPQNVRRQVVEYRYYEE